MEKFGSSGKFSTHAETLLLVQMISKSIYFKNECHLIYIPYVISECILIHINHINLIFLHHKKTSESIVIKLEAFEMEKLDILKKLLEIHYYFCRSLVDSHKLQMRNINSFKIQLLRRNLSMLYNN